MTYLDLATYRLSARMMTSVSVSPRRSASRLAAFHRSLGTLTDRGGVWSGFTPSIVPVVVQSAEQQRRTLTAGEQGYDAASLRHHAPALLLASSNDVLHGLSLLTVSGK